jgi:DNA-binding MarR family transcriptional regulator
MSDTIDTLLLPEDADAPVSPPVALDAPAVPVDPDADLDRLMTAFRVLQMHHARVLHRSSTERGLNATDVRFVFFLAASDEGGVTPKQAGEYLELTTGAMTSLVDRLEKRGHLERRPNPDDRRSVLLHLTETGEDIAREIGGVYTHAFREVIDPRYRADLADAFVLLGATLEHTARGDIAGAAGQR